MEQLFPYEHFTSNHFTNRMILKSEVDFNWIENMLRLDFMESNESTYFYYPIEFTSFGECNFWMIIESCKKYSKATLHILNSNIDIEQLEKLIIKKSEPAYEQLRVIMDNSNLEYDFIPMQISTASWEMVINFLQAITFTNISVNRHYKMNEFLKNIRK